MTIHLHNLAIFSFSVMQLWWRHCIIKTWNIGHGMYRVILKYFLSVRRKHNVTHLSCANKFWLWQLLYHLCLQRPWDRRVLQPIVQGRQVPRQLLTVCPRPPGCRHRCQQTKNWGLEQAKQETLGHVSTCRIIDEKCQRSSIFRRLVLKFIYVKFGDE